jgi:hypothetical protein
MQFNCNCYAVDDPLRILNLSRQYKNIMIEAYRSARSLLGFTLSCVTRNGCTQAV